MRSGGTEDAVLWRHGLSWLQWEADGELKLDSDRGCSDGWLDSTK